MSEEQSQVGDEFERQPVPKESLLGFKSFIGMYAGEHCAGTELVIGPLFVAAGVSAFDLIFGLILGNLLAVLSWLFICAPIATRARLTLYNQLEKICGRNLVTLYNLANGVMFCFLAGSMITVSATAVCACLNLPTPKLDAIAPDNISWMLSVLGIGVLISIVAAYGYNTVSKFANIAAPWMVFVFVVFGIVALRQFILKTDQPVDSLSGLWNLASTEIWKGGDPLSGKVKFTFWHVTFFAWFCNLAMHIGMSDLTIFRYAKKSWYGIAPSSGMYLGHFVAWISASLMFAYYLLENNIKPEDVDKIVLSPGDMAFSAAGYVGLLCVIIAGWTTANPTIYRAGLAFQAVVPKVSRFKMTIATGMVATVAGMFPGIAMQMLGFVALYGMVLMPMGAVIFVDFYLLQKFGMKSNYAEFSRKTFNWAAGLTWFITLGTCVVLVKFFGIQLYFVSLPGWFVAAILYMVLSKVYQNKVHQ